MTAEDFLYQGNYDDEYFAGEVFGDFGYKANTVIKVMEDYSQYKNKLHLEEKLTDDIIRKFGWEDHLSLEQPEDKHFTFQVLDNSGRNYIMIIKEKRTSVWEVTPCFRPVIVEAKINTSFEFETLMKIYNIVKYEK